MTTPSERLRSLQYAEELLRRIARDPQAPETVRREADRLGRCYPSQHELLSGFTMPGTTLSPSCAEAIFAAGAFLAGLTSRDLADIQARQLLQTAMRHYPTERDGFHNASCLQAVPLNELLAEWDM